MKRLMLVAILAASGLMAAAATASATTIINGDFTQGPTAPNGYYIELGYGNTSITGWTVGGNSIDYINPAPGNTYWTVPSGRGIDMSGSAPGSLSQTLTTTVGQSYIVSFEMAGNIDGTPSIKTMYVDATGTAPQTYTFNTAGITSYANLGWTLDTYRFTATSTSTVLTFTDHSFASIDPPVTSPYGSALADVSIASVPGAAPEPSSWALLLLGVGGVGFAMRRRSKQRKLAVA